ncbi:MAG: recombination protein O N-terminal domain-containing protein [Candidatus Paceibacterota bacterium]|jgi:DNA repair protein RecO
MYHIRTTPGFIIGSRPFGEAGKAMSIFTREFGLLNVRALGIRLEKSKLRYHAREYTFGHFSLVKGKEYWRLTGAISDSTPLDSKIGNGLLGKIAFILDRLLHGEDPNPELFDGVKACESFLRDNASLSRERACTLESLVMIRIMRELGYVGGKMEDLRYVDSIVLTIEILDEIAPKRQMMNKHINKALRESHL